MRLATWNVNSIRARDARLRAWLASRAPDVVCLQELKCEVAQLPEWLAADVHRQRGEFVIVLHGRTRPVEAAVAAAHDPMLRTLLASLPLKQAVALAAELSGAPRNALYERALALKDGSA